jgi:hypothetical protein
MVLNPTQFDVGSNPVPEVAAGAARYRQMLGYNSPEQNYNQSVIPASAARAIGQHYMGMPEHDPAAVPAYRQMGEEVGRQFDFMTKSRSKGGMGINVDSSDTDPYGGFKTSPNNIINDLRGDVEGNSHISVLSTKATGGHPVFSNDRNDMFRAVHDVFGHLGSGRAVDFNGEDAAYQKHAAMFSPLARGALATETRGQNNALRLTGGFPQQKVGILPQGMQRPGNLNPEQFGGQSSEMPQARNLARAKNKQFGVT